MMEDYFGVDGEQLARAYANFFITCPVCDAYLFHQGEWADECPKCHVEIVRELERPIVSVCGECETYLWDSIGKRWLMKCPQCGAVHQENFGG